MEKLSIKAAGVSIGGTWSLCMLLAGLSTAYLGWGNSIVGLMSSLYIGYSPTLGGSLIGAVW